jgi:hypothetical protein
VVTVTGGGKGRGHHCSLVLHSTVYPGPTQLDGVARQSDHAAEPVSVSLPPLV